jgi:hypothetical protein
MNPHLRSTTWGQMWLKYEACLYCPAEAGEPCEDQRPSRRSRWRFTLKPHPERKHARIKEAS